MNTHTDKTQDNKSKSVANEISKRQSGGESIFQFVDNRPEAIAQRKLQEMANNSPQVKRAAQLQAMANNDSAQQQQPIQKKENNTELPNNSKSGIENFSGYSMDYVKGNVQINDDGSLEKEGDVKGAKALQMKQETTWNTPYLNRQVSNTTQFSLQKVVQLFDAGNGAQWHIHHEHIKLGNMNDSRVEFNGRSKKEIRKELGEKISRYNLNVR